MIKNLTWEKEKASPEAFLERQALMPIWGGLSVPQEQWQSLWHSKAIHSLEEDGLAYIHIPFCVSHCVFCGFYRNAWHEDNGKAYTDKVIAELAYEAKLRAQNPKNIGKIKAVYFGGGTPTALDTPDLVRLIKACYEYLPLAEDCEFTLEGRISHFPIEKARACVEAGVNRISIGLQTFNSDIRKRLGRRHTGEEALEYLKQLCELDAVIVADLIFGLPNQTDEVWKRDIEIASTLPLAGLDTYAFNNYPFLPINKLINKGTLPPPEGLASQAYHYAYAVEELTKNGWTQVSNNHFAFPNRGERNLYNSLVKSDMPCLAFGSAAGGNFGGFSYQVQSELQNYLSTPANSKNLSYFSKHGENKKLLSQVQYSIELGYLDTNLFADHERAQALIKQWQVLELLQVDTDGIAKLNVSGRYWSPTLIRKLMLSLPQTEGEETTMTKLSEEQKAALRNDLSKNPAQILEMVAMKYQCSLEEVMNCLPAEMIAATSGERFVEIMQAIHAWDDEVTFIAHTEDAIVEVTGKLPNGKVGRGFYNFEHQEGGGVHGHLRYENCSTIYLLDRPFMGKRAVSLTFVNPKGNAMFKIFVGRDRVRGDLKEHQVEALYQLIKG